VFCEQLSSCYSILLIIFNKIVTYIFQRSIKFTNTVGSDEVTPSASQKVNLSVYYASLSQPSATFIVKNLEEIFHSDLINIINLQQVPWANAYVNKTNQSIICQVLFYGYYLCYALKQLEFD